MRAREPDSEGYVGRDGVKLHYEVFGDGPGSGRSDRPLDPAPYRWEPEGRSALAVLDAAGADRAALVSLSTEGWARYNRQYWLDRWEDFVAFFAECFPEPHSTRQVEDCVGWALETTPQVLVASEEAGEPDEAAIRRWCARVVRPPLVVHGDRDRISPLRSGAALARATGGRLVVLGGAGHIPNARDPVRINRLIREFAESLPAGGAA